MQHPRVRSRSSRGTGPDDLSGSGRLYLDMNLSLDAATLFFSFRRRTETCWQIYEIGVDGQGLKRISRDPACHDVSAVELPGGDLLFVSTRCGGYLVSEPGPRSNLWVMRRDGSARAVREPEHVGGFLAPVVARRARGVHPLGIRRS